MILPDVVAVVDDDASILQAMQRALTAHGYRVKAFSSAEQYLEEVDASEIMCAVIDIELGGPLSGLDLGRKISSSVRATPIVFMSGSHDLGVCERAKDICCIDFLKKPFTISTLIATLTKLDSLDS